MAEKTGLGKVAEFFGMKLGEFRTEWAELSPEDKAQIREGIESGSLTY